MVDNIDLTKLLRNTCRAVHIPVVLSGTNAKVQNLIGKSDISASRDDGVFPWVKVATKLPKATLKSFGPWISFNPLSDLNSLVYLDSFANSIGEMDYEELLGSLLFRQDFTTDGDWEFLKDLLKFTINQTRTNLPGLGIISLNILIELLIECRGKAQINRKMLWKSLVERIQQFVLKRKKNIKNVEGRIASAHILTFPSHLKDAHEVGEPAGQKVDSHLFFFGLPGDSGVFSLSAGIELEINQDVVVFERDNVSWRDHCFFPRISDDFFAHLVCWNAWFIKINGLEYSLAGLYEKYLNRPGLGVDSTAIVANSFSLELLAHWSACYASHLSVHGETLGVSFVGEFIKNLQVPPVSDRPVKINTIDLPDSLEEFLSDVTVPYLVPPNLISEEVVGSDFLKSVKSFINFGKSWRPANKVGWDVIFEASVGGLIKNCFIECKLWSRSIGLALIFKYYSRACDLGSPISFLVAKSFLKTLEDKFENVTDDNFANEPKAEDEDNEPLTPLAAMPINLVDKSEIAKAKKSIKEAPQTKKAKIPAISKESFIDLWKVPKNRINIYTVEPVIIRFNNSISFNFRIIKEFDQPAGIFIITKSTFSPPSLSGSS